VLTKALERINNQTVEKYDVWNDRNRMIHVRLGLDPLGGTNPNASSVRWTPRLYSHLHYSNPALATVASNTTLTVFVHFKGEGVEWHLYGIDDCVLTETDPPPPLLIAPKLDPDGSFSCQVGSEAGEWVRIEGSSDLGSWVALTNVLNATGLTRFTDPGGAPRRFYRASAPASP